MTGREVLAAIERGCVIPAVREIAVRHFVEAAAKALADEHTRAPGKIRASDAGRCVRETWADLHDRLDLPQDATTQLSRFDIGTIYGAWLASILKATLESEDVNVRVDCEVAIERHGIPGHVDAIVMRCDGALLLPKFDDYRPDITVEFKSTYGLKNKELPSEKKFYQVAQVTHYALEKEHKSDRAAIITFAPAAWPVEDRFVFEDIDPEVYELRTEMEYARLAPALLDEIPDGDPDAKWRCSGCRASWCEQNTNNAVDMVEI